MAASFFVCIGSLRPNPGESQNIEHHQRSCIRLPGNVCQGYITAPPGSKFKLAQVGPGVIEGTLIHCHGGLPAGVLDGIAGIGSVERDGHIRAGEINAGVMADVGFHFVASTLQDVRRPFSRIIGVVGILHIGCEIQVGIVISAQGNLVPAC